MKFSPRTGNIRTLLKIYATTNVSERVYLNVSDEPRLERSLGWLLLGRFIQIASTQVNTSTRGVHENARAHTHRAAAAAAAAAAAKYKETTRKSLSKTTELDELDERVELRTASVLVASKRQFAR
eukprot:SAG31_NODE_4877_length_2890_cov_1.569330_2_plen_125_part_00